MGISGETAEGRADRFIDTMGGSPTASYIVVENPDFDPYKNEQMLLHYTVEAPGRQSVTVRDIDHGYNTVKVLVGSEPKPIGDRTDPWDGRDETGEIFTGTYDFWFDYPYSFRTKTIILRDAFEKPITDYSSNAYAIFPIQAEISKISYALDADANMTVTIQDPNGNHFRTLVNNELQGPGDYEYTWDGTNDLGEYATLEGSYRLLISATDQQTNSTKESVGSVTVHQ